MKTLVALLIALSGGAALGVATVAGTAALVDPDRAVEQGSEGVSVAEIEVLPYGERA